MARSRGDRMTWSDGMRTAEHSAFREYGKQHYGMFLALVILRKIWVPLLVLGPVAAAAVLFVRHVGADAVSPSSPDSVSPWPWVVIVISALGIFALFAHRWWNPGGRRPVSTAAILILALICALAILWVRT